MPKKKFDPTFKALVELGPEDWTGLTCGRRAPTTIIDADIATVSGAADKVLHVADTAPYLLHLDFQAGHDSAELPPLLLQRNVLLHVRHRLPVRTVVVPLRPEADSPALTGRLEVRLANEKPHLVFRYQVLRVFELSPKIFLEGGLALLPLATISNATEGQLPAIIDSIEERLSEPAARGYSSMIWSATGLVMGLRYTPETIYQTLRRIMGIEESSVYQDLLQRGEARGLVKGAVKGALDEARKLVLKLGKKRFGLPNDQVKTALKGMVDVADIERLHDKLLDVKNWEELLDLPRTKRKKSID